MAGAAGETKIAVAARPATVEHNGEHDLALVLPLREAVDSSLTVCGPRRASTAQHGTETSRPKISVQLLR